ncbi:hypothetical protein QWY75_01435 [Pontixanthobacter aestiaquae]|uniref:TPM domain-containing protein n=1 Tax=Pontixanthobacter aestiaquae TaxID=1509367 RepID=A0A844ZAB2_9SPHN|nr:hypothetical protein [Pontixanthobacter aestiaquae]MDN3644863.1 hypothetical protein [Pontixanthobacter aestiaquae]MXO84136.1 hypothetical protein [Pontixanthobacter aestiaquae]
MSRKPYLDAQSHAIVTNAVAEAELTTSGEIVTVLAERSDGYTDIALVWCSLAAFLALTFCVTFPDLLLDTYAGFHNGWNTDWSAREVFAMAAGAAIFWFLILWLIQLSDTVKFALIPGKVKTLRVHDRAVAHFKVGAERRTHGRTGIMIYLSMREHRAEIVADEPIAELVDAEVWGEAMADMLVEIKQGRIAEGMAAGVRDVGKVLSEHFPRAEDDQNELPDRLIEV